MSEVRAVPADVLDIPLCVSNPWKCKDAAEDVAKGSQAVKNTIDFASDPLGFIAGKMQEAASGLTNDVLPQLIRATSPDFTAAWFVDTYQVSFGIACCLFILLVLRLLVDFGGRRVGSDEVIDSLTRMGGMFFIGAAFGPAVATAVVGILNALTVQIVKWGIGGTAQDMGAAVKRIDTVIRNAGPNGISGGSVMAIIVYLLLLIGLLVLFLILIVTFVTLYMTGAVAPIAWAWLVHPETKDKAWKIVRVFIGLVTAKPIAFFMLAVAFKISAAGLFGVQGGAEKPVQALVGVLSAAVALIMAGFAPMMLNKLAPIGVTEASGGSPRLTSPGGGGGGRGGAGKSSESSGQLAQAAMAGAAASTGGTAGLAMAASQTGGSGGGQSFSDKLTGGGDGDTSTSTSGGGGGGSNESGVGGQEPGGEGGSQLKDTAQSGSDQDGSPGAGESDSAAPGGTDGGSSSLRDTANSSGATGNSADGSTGDSSLRDAATSSSSSGGGDGAESSGTSGDGDDQKSGGLGQKLAGVGSTAADAARVGASGLRSVAGRGGALADQLEGQVDAEMDHAATHGRRPR